MKSPLRALATLLNKTPVPYASRFNVSAPWSQPAGMEAQMRAMGSVGTLFAIVSRISNATSQVEWKLWRKALSGRKEDRVEVARHPALDLWNMPNPFMPRQEFVETFMQHVELAGEGWWVVAKSARSPMPLELWPVRPDRMEPVPHPTDFLSGYVYRAPDGQAVPLETTDVIFLRTPNPLDPYRGMSPVQTLMVDLEAERAAAEWNRNFFLNSAEPGGIIEAPHRLDDNEFNELRDRWDEQHRGVSNAHRVAIIENGLKWVDRKFTQRDMEFSALRNLSSEKIREAFGFPLPLLGTVTDVNRANAEAANVVFARWLIIPRLERIKAALNTELLPLYGPGADALEFDYENPVPDDVALEAEVLSARVAAAVDLVDAGWNPDDSLEAVGLPKIRHGAPAPTAPAPGTGAAGMSMLDVARAVKARGQPDEEPLEDAWRWVVVTTKDSNRCKPCADNDGRLYRNRGDAYKDYPGGSNYIHCLGEEHGNQCRCRVVRRGRKGKDT